MGNGNRGKSQKSLENQQKQAYPVVVAITFISESKAAKAVGLSARTLRRRRYDGNGPKFYKIGGKAIRYDLKEVEEWAKKEPGK